MLEKRLCIVLNVISMLWGLNTATNWNGNDLKDLPERIAIGALFPNGVNQLQTVFKQSIHQHNSNASQRFIVETAIEFIDYNDPAKIVRHLQCLHFNRGIYAFLAPNFGTSAYQSALSFSNTYRVPFVGLPPIFSFHKKSHNEFYGLNIEPNHWPAIVSVLKWYSWNKIIYLYDSDDGIFNLQELLRQAHRSDHSLTLLTVKRIATAGDGYNLLKSLHKDDKRTRKFVVLNCNLLLAKAMIGFHIQDTAMDEASFHYLLTNLMLNGSWDEEITAYFKAVNITTFGLPAETTELAKLIEMKSSESSLDDYLESYKKTPSLEEVLTFDGTKVLLDTFDLIVRSHFNISKALETDTSQFHFNFTKKNIDSTCPTLKPFKFGDIISNHLKIIKTFGITGNIEFHGNGFRKNYTIDILEINNSTGSFIKIASWSDIMGISISHTSKMREKISSENYTYLVTSILEEPFLMRKSSYDASDSDQYEGYVKDLADSLANELNFKYKIKIVNDSKYGAIKQVNGSWSGMIGELVRNEVDMAIAPLTMNYARQKVIDFTQPFMTTGISILMKKPETEDRDYLAFLKPLSKEVWGCVLIALVVFSIIFYITSKATVRSNENSEKISFCASLCYSFGVLMYQVAGIFPKSISARIASTFWWFFVFITITSYLANLTAQSVSNRIQYSILSILDRNDLTSDSNFYYDKMLFPITSTESLAAQDRIQYGLLRHSSTEAFFSQSKKPIFEKMWKKMNQNPIVFVDSYKEGIDQVRQSNGEYAFLLESAMNDFVNSRKPCDTFKIGQNFHEISYGIGIPLGSPLRERLNGAILKLRDNGKLESLKQKWWEDRQQCNLIKDHLEFFNNGYTKLINISGVILILIIGLTLALVVSLIEFSCKSRHQRAYIVSSQDDLIEERRNEEDIVKHL